jgi:hypothetical protein
MEVTAVMHKCLLVLAAVFGLLIAYVDSRPGWDDTGVTAGLIFLVCFLCGAVDGHRPRPWALTVGLWIPTMAMIATRNYGAWLALVVAL